MKYSAIWVCLFVLTTFSVSTELDGTVISNEANKFIGTPYVYGGNCFKKGIDCSAFVKGLYAKHGFSLPRRAEWQVMGTKSCPTYTDIRDTQVGDALYFRENKGKGRIHHVALVTGFNNGGTPIITHAKGKKFGVVREVMSNRYMGELTAIKRFSECSSVLQNKFSEEEMASVILYLADKYHLSTEGLYRIVAKSTDLKPLTFFLQLDEDTMSVLMAGVGKGVRAVRSKDMRGIYLYVDNIFQAQYIASEFKKANMPFRAGVALAPSSSFTQSNISEIFYPMINIEKSIVKIKHCMGLHSEVDKQVSCLVG